MTLTDKQRRFVEAYLREPNAKQAAIAAGYSVKTAEQAGPRLLRNVQVAQTLNDARRTLEVRTGITPERVLTELAKLGFSDIRAVVQWRTAVHSIEENEDGDPVMKTCNEVVISDSDTLSDEAAAAILEVSQTKDGALKVKMHDKLGALVKIGQHLGMFRPLSPEEVGKKEKAQNEANTAGLGSDWGDDLAMPGARPN